MKRALSLAVALLLVFAVMPRNAVKVNAAALPSEQPEEYVEVIENTEKANVRSGMSERELRWAALDEESLADDQAHAEALKQQIINGRDPGDPFNYEEAWRLYNFYFDYIDDFETTEAFHLLSRNIDRMWGFDASEMWPDVESEPAYWYEMDEDGNCVAICAFLGYQGGGLGGFEAEWLDVSSGIGVESFQNLSVIKIQQNYLTNVNASGCPSLDRFNLADYDGAFIWNDSYTYGMSGCWDPVHHASFVDLSQCLTLD